MNSKKKTTFTFKSKKELIEIIWFTICDIFVLKEKRKIEQNFEFC